MRKARSSRVNSSKPVLLVGMGKRDELYRVYEALEAKYPQVAQSLLDRNYVEFDMSTHPERGDVLDHLHEGSAVIGFNLYFDDYGTDKSFYYNKQNQQLIPKAKLVGIPVFLFGDHPFRPEPDDKDAGRWWRAYLPKSRQNSQATNTWIKVCSDCRTYLQTGRETRRGLAADIHEMWPDFQLVVPKPERTSLTRHPCDACNAYPKGQDGHLRYDAELHELEESKAEARAAKKNGKSVAAGEKTKHIQARANASRKQADVLREAIFSCRKAMGYFDAAKTHWAAGRVGSYYGNMFLGHIHVDVSGILVPAGLSRDESSINGVGLIDQAWEQYPLLSRQLTEEQKTASERLGVELDRIRLARENLRKAARYSGKRKDAALALTILGTVYKVGNAEDTTKQRAVVIRASQEIDAWAASQEPSALLFHRALNRKVDTIPEGTELCERCGGAGYISAFQHIDGGVCYECGGSGLTEERTPARRNGGSRVLYHIGPRPPSPKPYKKGGEWERKGREPVRVGVFLTPNPVEISIVHQRKGHVYAVEVPFDVIRKSGGILKYDFGHEILIPEHLWSRVKFLGKSMDAKHLRKLAATYREAPRIEVKVPEPWEDPKGTRARWAKDRAVLALLEQMNVKITEGLGRKDAAQWYRRQKKLRGLT